MSQRSPFRRVRGLLGTLAVVLPACASPDPLRTEAALAAFVTASRLPVSEGAAVLIGAGVAGTCQHEGVVATGPDATCGCEEGCRWHYESTAACTGRVWAGPWDDGTSLDSLSNRIFVDASGESMANDEAPVPPPAFETAEIVLHATMVADSEPPECGSDEYASHGSRTWTGEAFVGGDPHGFVTVLEWYWGGDRWSVALDGQPAVVWDLEYSTR